MEISPLNNKLSTLFHLRPCQDHIKHILRSTWVSRRIWIMMRLKEKHWGWWKRNGKRSGKEVMEAEERMGLVEREKVQRLGLVTTDPWLHCCTNKQAICRLPWVQLWCRRGKLSFQGAEVEPGKWWDGAWLSTRSISSHLHQQVNEQRNRATSNLRSLLIACHFLHL